MKIWLLLLCSLPLSVIAQDTCGLKKSKDPFTNQMKYSTGFKNFGGSAGPISISADANATEIDFFIWLKTDGKCFDLESTAELVWEGERSKATFRNTGSLNCNGAFHFSFKNTNTTQSWLRKMMAKRIATIKLTGNNDAVTLIELTPEQKDMFQRMAICIANEGKELIKK